MRRIRFVALAFISFVTALICAFLAPGTFLHRVLSVATCTVFSFNSTLCVANLARSGERVVAAEPPAVVVQGNTCGSGSATQPTMQRGNDSTMYQVYYDFRRGKETVNSDACGREYWISSNSKHPLYGIRFVYLVNGQRNRVVPTLYFETASGDLKVWDNNVAAARLANPFSPSLGIASNPNPTRPQATQVNRPNSSQPAQSQLDLSSIWLYSIYLPSSDGQAFSPIYSNRVEITQTGDEYKLSLCEFTSCSQVQPSRSNAVNRVPKKQSIKETYEDVTIETVESTDGNAIWGEISELNSKQIVYFKMERQASPVSMSPAKHLSIKADKKSSILAELPPIGGGVTPPGSGGITPRITPPSIPSTIGLPSSGVDTFTRVNPVTRIEPTDLNMAFNP